MHDNLSLKKKVKTPTTISNMRNLSGLMPFPSTFSKKILPNKLTRLDGLVMFRYEW